MAVKNVSTASLKSKQPAISMHSDAVLGGGGGVAVATSPSLVCVECGRPVELLFRQYTSNIRLGRCGYCRSVADKYVECEFVLIAIDLALHRIQAYRHVIFNRKPFSTHSFHGRLWQLGVAMAALDAHLRHTALSNDPSSMSAPSGGHGANITAGDPFWEAGGLLLAAVIEHACFAAGAVLGAHRITATASRNRAREGEGNKGSDDGAAGAGVVGGDGELSSPRGRGEGDSLAKIAAGAGVGESAPTLSATKMYMAVVYPLFFRLLAAFVMIWDRRVAILNTIELLVATMQFVALLAVIGGPATRGSGMGGVGEGRAAAAAAVFAGLAAKMCARGLLCQYLGTDTRTLTML